MDYQKILENVKRDMRNSYFARSQSSDEGNDWLTFVMHVSGHDIRLARWLLFQAYIERQLYTQIENLSSEDKRELWQIALAEAWNEESYLKDLEIEKYSEEYYQVIDENKIEEFLYSKLWEAADKDYCPINDEEFHDEDDEGLYHLLNQMSISINISLKHQSPDVVLLARKMEEYLNKLQEKIDRL